MQLLYHLSRPNYYREHCLLLCGDDYKIRMTEDFFLFVATNYS